MIIRPQYMELLKTYRDVPLVKILAGIRRCGKSTILEMLRDDLLKSGVSADHIISMRYTSEDFNDGMTDKDMCNGIKEQMTSNGRYYLLLNEVQEIDGWEKAVNSLLENADTDIYVTGSNSKLISSEISTYLTGRYIVENVGKTFSANAIVKFLKSEGRSLSVEAVYNYLNWLEKAFVIYRCQRYDLQGKSVLKTQEKFYLADSSLKYCIMGFNPKSIAAMLENIVYFELRRKGYDVYIGKTKQKR